MNTAAASLFSPATAAANGMAARGEDASAAAPQHVGELPELLSDEQREAAIRVAGDRLVERYAEWDRTGCFAARADADKARDQQAALIKGRSQAQVARMEAERGLL